MQAVATLRKRTGGINGMTPTEKFMKCLEQSILIANDTKSVIDVGTLFCQLCGGVQQLSHLIEGNVLKSSCRS